MMTPPVGTVTPALSKLQAFYFWLNSSCMPPAIIIITNIRANKDSGVNMVLKIRLELMLNKYSY
jgi:hypothetical protein